jgi:hypothetical protein
MCAHLLGYNCTLMHNYFSDNYALVHKCEKNMRAHVCTYMGESHALEARIRVFEILNFLMFLMDDEG